MHVQLVSGLIPSGLATFFYEACSWKIFCFYDHSFPVILSHWYKKGSCQCLVRECAQVLVNHLRGLSMLGKVWLGEMTGSTWT